MFRYDICNEPNEEVFALQCEALEKRLPNLIKGHLIHDVDDSKVQPYEFEGKAISVHNSYYLGAVYIESEVDLKPLFS